MYHVNAQGIDERMINVHYYYYYIRSLNIIIAAISDACLCACVGLFLCPGTGNIVVDMENQVKANTMRIQVLEEQNEGLRRSITKVLSLGHSGGTAAHQQPKVRKCGIDKMWTVLFCHC